MPVMGPERRSQEEIDKITKCVLEYLSKSHGIHGPHKSTFSFMRNCWNKDVEALKKAIDDLCWSDSCIGF